MGISEREAIGILERQDIALEMRKRGIGFRQIAKELGISHTQAFLDVKAALGDLEATAYDRATELRDVMIARLEDAIRAIDEEVQAGNYYAIDRLIKIQDQIATLAGIKIERKDITTAGAPIHKITSDDIKFLLEKAKRDLDEWKEIHDSTPALTSGE